MKNKLRSILLIMLLLFASIQIIFLNESNTLADPGDGGGNGNNFLDFGFMWNITSYLANIIHDVSIYGPVWDFRTMTNPDSS